MPTIRSRLAVAAMLGAFAVASLNAQGVTTAAIAGTVTGPGGAGVTGAIISATHKPSGTAYATTARADGRFAIAGMRVGGPYLITARAIGFELRSLDDVHLQLGVTSDVAFTMSQTLVRLDAVAITAEGGQMSSGRTGASTTVNAEALRAFPTIGRTITDFTRLTPQATGFGSFAGQDNRLNNISVDGSYFNNSFGLGAQPGGRTGVSPIPLDAVDQIQIAIAPYDVRQGNFIGAGVNAVTKSGTNEYSGSFYTVSRDDAGVGRLASGTPFDPGTFKFNQWGARLSGPLIKNKLFFFVNYEDDELTEPGTTWLANSGGQPVSGNTTRVLASDLSSITSFLQSKFDYATGTYEGYNNATPSTRIITKLDWNANAKNKFSFRYIQLESQTDNLVSNSSSLGFGRRRTNSNSMSFSNSGYAILENIKSTVGEWNAQIGSNLSNNMIAGYTTNDESRDPKGAFFPMVDILQDGVTYMNFGFEPFTPKNQLRYNTWQFQDNLTYSTNNHDFTFGVSVQKYHSDNVFFPGSQSAYVYNSLADFYTDANDFLANPNRTTSPVTLKKFQVRYNNIPGQIEPAQPLDVLYSGVYAQDEWRVTNRLKLTAGIRLDVPKFDDTGADNPAASAMVFRDENGNPASYSTSKLPDANVLVSPRLGFNWDVRGDRSTQIRGGTGVFTGSPAYVWISNQLGQNGILTGFEQLTNTKARPFNPNPDHYKPATVTGAPAASYELNFTDRNYRFPQIWRSNIAIDHTLPRGIIGTVEYLYSSDLNGVYYINANLPEAQKAYTGPDTRPFWTSNRVVSNITSAYVLKNQSVGWSSNVSASLEKAFESGLYAKTAYNYGITRNTIDPGSIAGGSFTNNLMSGDPNNPGVGYSRNTPGHRFIVALSYKRDLFGFGETGLSFFGENRTQGSVGYRFSGDANGDGGWSNDLIYIAKNQSEMNFESFSSSGTTFTVDAQRAAWDAYIKQDEYLSRHRGQYAQKNAAFLPGLFRADVSISQDLSRAFRSKTNKVQARLDILNFTNMINSNWGVSDRFVTNTPLIPRGADANGSLRYRLRNIGSSLISETFQKNTGIADVYRIQLSLRYSFN
ncbi:MAG: carboxypeptidase regulatory-like domain-containing protein [Gemmatimonadetes bacterium]|nr:carboxypeptidase regulatory-like domain-containing protein [Gemmatimonadota bacterium]